VLLMTENDGDGIVLAEIDRGKNGMARHDGKKIFVEV
jgi:hypothetical protein